MTAIGFFAAIIGYGGAMIAHGSYSRLAQTVQTVSGLLIIAGGIAMVTGVAIKIWEVMP